MEVYIACEDRVTELIIRRLIAYCSSDAVVKSRLPARGGAMKSKKNLYAFNQLAMTDPVISLIDLDASDCAPQLKHQLLEGITHHENFIFNIAVDEAEAWLMADRNGFAKHFGLSVDDIPLKRKKRYNGPHYIEELDFHEKPSLYLTHRLAVSSTKKDVVDQLGTNGDACKGKEYNTAIEPFITEKWDIESALSNSDSLRRMINRLKRLFS